MTDSIEPIAAPVPAYPGAAYSLPTTGPDGVPLSPQQQIDALTKIPQFVQNFSTPGSMESGILDRLNRQAAGFTPAPPAPALVDPGLWRIPYPQGTDPDSWSPEMAAGDKQLRAWLSAAGVDKATGDGLALLVAERLNALHGTDQSKADIEAEKVLRDVYRDDYEEKLWQANEFIGEIEDQEPGFKAFVKESGLGNDPQFINRIVGLAELRG